MPTTAFSHTVAQAEQAGRTPTDMRDQLRVALA